MTEGVLSVLDVCRAPVATAWNLSSSSFETELFLISRRCSASFLKLIYNAPVRINFRSQLLWIAPAQRSVSTAFDILAGTEWCHVLLLGEAEEQLPPSLFRRRLVD